LTSWRPAGDHAALRGRDTEQLEIGRLLRRAGDDAPVVLLVEGDRGIGKSALLNYAASEAAGQGFSLAAAAGDRLGRHVPFFALRTAVGAASWAAETEGHRGGPALLRRQLSRLGALLAARAAVAPVLICLDDTHWASEETLQALGVLPGELAGHPMAWILARTRTSDGAGTAAECLFGALEHGGAGRISLGPLSDRAVADMLADAFAAPPHEKLLAMAAGAAGNPSLVAALAAGLRDDGAVEIVEGRARPASDLPPRRVDQVARSWLGGLTGPTRHMLGAAGVLGRTFRLDDVADMLGEPRAALLPRLAEALDEEIVMVGDEDVSFRHGLVAHAAAGLIPAPARRTLHRQFAELLLSRGEPAAAAASHLLNAAQPGDLASLSGLDQVAARMLRCSPRTAADLAVLALEYTAPADPARPRRAVAAAEALAAAGRPEPAARIARELLGRPLQAVAEARLRCALSSALCASGQAQDARAEARQALAAIRGWPASATDLALAAELQALAALADDDSAGRLSASILASPGRHGGHLAAAAVTASAAKAWREGKVNEALALLRDAVSRAGGVSPDATHCQPALDLAARLVDLRQLDEAAAVIDAVDGDVLRGIPQEAVLPLLRARVHLANGDLDASAAEARAALAAAEPLAAHAYASAAHSVLGAVALRRGDVADAAGHVASRVAAVPHIATWYVTVECALLDARVSVARDGAAAAAGRVRQITARPQALRALLLADPSCASWLVRAVLAAGDRGTAVTVSAAADALAAGNPGCSSLAVPALHGRGLLERDTDRLGRALAGHRDAWATGSAAEDLAALLTGRTARGQALHYLELALGEYGRAGAAADQARVRRRLRKLGVRHRHWETPAHRPAAGWDSLTDTERAVAGLVAQGLTNRQAAGRMYISEHTVAFHLRQVFRKLSIGSRVDLARIAVERAGG